MRYLSLFSGIGGFELGIQQSYERLFHEMEQRGRGQAESELEATLSVPISESLFRQHPTCIGYSEIDKYAIKIYERHFPGHRNYGDITKISAEELPDFDLLVGGFPCQSFSIAGKRAGFSDTRGNLFFEIARILKEKQPRGYDLQWQVLNSKNFGVPQNRERVFIIGHLRGTPRPEVFPFGVGNEVNSKQDAQGNDVAHTLQCGDKHRGSYVRTDESSTQQKGNKPDSGNVIRRATYSDDMRIRRLTPTECERLQGFPDGWTEGVSDTQRYKCLGNAVTVNVVREIMKHLL